MTTWHIIVDQFGYRPGDAKVAVIADPQEGFNKKDRFTPGSTYQLRKTNTSLPVFTAAPTLWNKGKTDSLSGDCAWWFDFSDVTEPGEYYVYDVENQVKSYDFVIKEDVYERVLYHALRTFYYQREAIEHIAPFAEYPWFDKATWVEPRQDLEARDVFDRENPARYRDVSGGWMDAGDTNKYVTFIDNCLHDLLAVYESKPDFFKKFNLNIPESHLDAPDILSEIKWELDWCKKMQNDDGSAHCKCGTLRENPGTSLRNRDSIVRYYNGVKSSAAAIALAGVFAHAAAVFGTIEIYMGYAADLHRRAVASWNWYMDCLKKDTRNERIDNGEIMAGLANSTLHEQDVMALTAAVYLFALTGEEEYHDYVKTNYKLLPPMSDNVADTAATGFFKDATELATALLHYVTLPNADAGVKQAILDKYREIALADNLQIPYKLVPEQSAYRAYTTEEMFFWGNLRARSHAGYDAFLLSRLNLLPELSQNFKDRAASHMHYIHGVNPFATTFLTNMYSAGASKSIRFLYHEWFMDIPGHGMAAPPGYLPGGPDLHWSRDNPIGLMPPDNQPPMKSYADVPYNFARAHEHANGYTAYAYTENMCGYQSSYIRLLACFV